MEVMESHHFSPRQCRCGWCTICLGMEATLGPGLQASDQCSGLNPCSLALWASPGVWSCPCVILARDAVPEWMRCPWCRGCPVQSKAGPRCQVGEAWEAGRWRHQFVFRHFAMNPVQYLGLITWRVPLIWTFPYVIFVSFYLWVLKIFSYFFIVR